MSENIENGYTAGRTGKHSPADENISNMERSFISEGDK